MSSYLKRKWKLLIGAVFVTTLLLGTLSIQVVDRPNPDNRVSIGIGNEKVITLGHVVYAAGDVDYTYDGVDDDIQFQAALDELPVTGGRLVDVSAVQKNFSSTVTRAIANVTIVGTGAGSYFVNDGVTPIFTAGGNGWHFEGIRTDAGSINMGATTGYLWTNVTVVAQLYSYYSPTVGDASLYDLTVDALAATSDLDIGAHEFRAETFESDVVTGTAPFTIASTTTSTNLSADLVDGYQSARPATLVVAANNASAAFKAQADYLCDNTADEVQINVAIAASGGGRVLLSDGTFTLGADVDILISNVTLQGQGLGTILYTSTAGVKNIFADGGAGTELTNVTVRDMLIRGVNGGTNSGYGIHYQYTDDSKIINVRVENTGNDGIFLEYCDVGEVSHTTVTNSDDVGIGTSFSNDISFINCVSRENESDGFNCGSLNRGKFDNVRAVNNDVLNTGTYRGIVLNVGRDCSITASTVSGNDLYGIYLYRTSRTTITGCNIFQNTNDNIQIWGDATDNSDSNVIVGNVIWGSTNSNGIEISGGTDANNTTIKSNIMYSNSGPDILDAGNETSVDKTPSRMDVTLDLSGAATDLVVYHAPADSMLVGYTIVYSEATSADAGVNIRVGRYQDNVALDDDYFDTYASEVSQHLYASTYVPTTSLTQTLITAGDTVTVGTVGGKTGVGEVLIVLHVAEGVW